MSAIPGFRSRRFRRSSIPPPPSPSTRIPKGLTKPIPSHPKRATSARDFRVDGQRLAWASVMLVWHSRPRLCCLPIRVDPRQSAVSFCLSDHGDDARSRRFRRSSVPPPPSPSTRITKGLTEPIPSHPRRATSAMLMWHRRPRRCCFPIRVHPRRSVLGFAFPITAMTCDVGDSGD